MSGRGHFRAYVDRRFSADRLATIEWINGVIEEYDAQGYSLTVRQIYYQGVARGIIPNSGRSYDTVQSAVNDGRMAGLISWTAVEDRGRELMGTQTWDSPAQAVRQARSRYRRDLWRDQHVRPEVWVEKAALVGVVERICVSLRVDFYATRGYNSQSEAWRAGQRFARRVQEGQQTVVLHLGDHDPSGIDMTRDNHERLSTFAGYRVPVQRIALNMDQVEHYRPPPFHAKVTDARAEGYRRLYGDQCWELDALEPQVISSLIEQEVLRLRDQSLWDAAIAEEVHDLREIDEALSMLDPSSGPEEEEDDE